MQLNFGRFMENRGYGYVLRPAFMRETGEQRQEYFQSYFTS